MQKRNKIELYRKEAGNLVYNHGNFYFSSPLPCFQNVAQTPSTARCTKNPQRVDLSL